MNPQEQDQFWMLYNRDARPAIERACRATSRSRTDSGMDECDMMAWVDDKVWRMLETTAWPAFHDSPTPEIAADRLVDAAGLLARWSYLGLCRKYWRRMQLHAYGESQGEMSRVERLACARSTGEPVEMSEELKATLDQIRTKVSERVRGNVAASWPDRSERHRLALLLEVNSPEADAILERSVDGKMKPNTILQMKSRSRKHIRQCVQNVALLIGIAVIMLIASPVRASGEQTGGRKGRLVMPIPEDDLQVRSSRVAMAHLATTSKSGGEQSGGRGG